MLNISYHSIFSKAVVGAVGLWPKATEGFYLHQDSYRNNYIIYRTLRQTLSKTLLFIIYLYAAYSNIFADYVCR